jgi:diguanylate cyclase (GGDEF)-like protein
MQGVENFRFHEYSVIRTTRLRLGFGDRGRKLKKLRTIYQTFKRPLGAALVATIVMITLSVSYSRSELDAILKAEKSRAEAVGQHLFTQLQIITIEGEAGTNAMEANAVSNAGEHSDQDEQEFADAIMSSMPGWRNISISPNNCIKMVSPIAGNESALGYCLDSNATEWREIELLIETKEPRMLGPFELAQGGIGYIYHRPVFDSQNRYWGLVSAVIDQTDFIYPIVTAANEEGMFVEIQVSDQNDENQTLMFSNITPEAQIIASQKFEVLGNTFTLTTSPKRTDYGPLVLTERRMTGATILSAVAVFLVSSISRKQRSTYRKLQSISRLSPSVLFQITTRKDGQLVLEFVSDNCEQLLGISKDAISENPLILEKLFQQQDLQRATDRLKAAKSPGEIWNQRLALVEPVNGRAWIQADATFERITGSKFGWNGVLVDATDVVEKELANELTSKAFDVLEEGVIVFDRLFNVVNVNKGLTRATGYNITDTAGRNIVDFCGNLNGTNFYREVDEALESQGIWRGQVYFHHRNGEVRREFISFSALKNSLGEIVEIVGVLNSTQNTLVDHITGFANRLLFEENLGRAIQFAKENEKKIAVLHIGVVGIGAVNDSFGHKIGDQILREIAERLVPFASSGESAGRVADSEFVIYRTLRNETEDIDVLAKSIVEELSRSFVYDDVSVLVEPAVGVSFYPDDASNTAELRSHADQAYKATMSKPGSKVGYFSNAYEDGARARSYLSSFLQEAVKQKRITFYYQPIVRISDGMPFKAEVLARWFDDQLGEISPARFIPLAESTKQIRGLGQQLLEDTLQTASDLLSIGKQVQLSVNVSPVEFMSDTFISDKEDVFSKFPSIKKESIIFELTEGIFLEDKERVVERIQEFRKQGIHFAIDDFGTGYSSLSYLQQLRVDFVKIDKSFIDQIDTVEGLAVCKSIVDLAHAIDLGVIAEGVETQAQLKLLKSIDCDCAQGYLFSKPLSKPDFLALMSSQI